MSGRLAPVVEDLSLYVQGGRIRNAAAVIDDAVEGERLGLYRIWLSERYDLKEAGVLLGGMAARTTRLELGTAALFPRSRPVIVGAALGATFQSAFGPRLTLGLGRSMGAYVENANLRPLSFRELRDYAGMYRRLWAGETVDYDGPLGTFAGLHMADTYDGPPPKIYSVMLGGPKACRVAASPLFDGVYLQPFMTVEAVRNSVTWIREECERSGRDFAELRIVAPMISAPMMAEAQERAYMHARMVTYIGQPGMLDVYRNLNGWDASLADPIRNHPLFAGDPDRVDHHFHRADLMEVAKLVPDEWVYETSLSGPLADCVAKMRAYRDAGAHEICLYGSTPAENAGLIEAWREHAARDGGGAGVIELGVLQALRMKGRALPGAVATATGSAEEAVRAVLTSLTARGLVVEKAGRLRLSAQGRDALAAALAQERAALDGPALERIHNDFVALNGPFKALASRWQQGEAAAGELDALHPRLLALLARLQDAVPRTSHYRARFEHAIAALRAGDRSWFLAPLVDSYHTVWFELHEELIGLTGRTRAAEAAAGRAQ